MRERKSAIISHTSSEGDPTSFSDDERSCDFCGKKIVINRQGRSG